MTRKFPIGQQDFRKLREEGKLYVDKTEIIHTLIDSGSYYFLSRPRRFGKSLLLSTVKEIFRGSKELFGGLWIENEWNWEKQHRVIHLSLSKVEYQKLGLYDGLSIELDQIAAELGVTLSSPNLKTKFLELIKNVAGEEKVVILIDEYDKPIIDYLDDVDKADENRNIFKNFYSVLKDADKYIRFLLITGVSRFSKVSLFSDLNHLSDITLIEEMNDICGITQDELETVFAEDLAALAGKFNKPYTDMVTEVKKWYNGYSWGGAHTLYNPFSLLSLLRWKQFDNYWYQTGTPAFFYDMLQRNPGLTFPDGEVKVGVEVLVDLFNQKRDYAGPAEIRPATIMFQTGYLTVKKYNPVERSYLLDFPNMEVRESMQVFLLGAYTQRDLETVRPTVLDIGDAFRSNDIESVIKLVDTQFASIPNTLWVGAGERFYHAIIHNTFGLLDVLMESERNYAGARPDITVFTQTHIYVLEFKLNGSAEAALSQIIDKDYFRPFQADGRKKVAIGVNFSSEKKAIEEYVMRVL